MGGRCDGVQIWKGNKIALQSRNPDLQRYGASDIILFDIWDHIIAYCCMKKDGDMVYREYWDLDEDEYIAERDRRAQVAKLIGERHERKTREEYIRAKDRIESRRQYDAEREKELEREELAQATAERQKRREQLYTRQRNYYDDYQSGTENPYPSPRQTTAFRETVRGVEKYLQGEKRVRRTEEMRERDRIERDRQVQKKRNEIYRAAETRR